MENNEKLFDIPAFILDAIRSITGGDENLFNAGVGLVAGSIIVGIVNGIGRLRGKPATTHA